MRAPPLSPRHGTNEGMFALTGGELSIVLFIFALVWGAAMLPHVLERVAVLRLRRSPEGR